MNIVSKNLSVVLSRIKSASSRIESERRTVDLIAVSKKQPIEAIQAAIDTGHRDFGENYAQELLEKVEYFSKQEISPPIKWHFIGQLQSNKVKNLVGVCGLIQSVDRTNLLDKIEKVASNNHVVQDILLQFNVSGEESKAGARVEDAQSLLEHCLNLTNVRVVGLMGFGKFFNEGAPEFIVKKQFVVLKGIRDALENQYSIQLPVLSMGVSGDFELAVKYGSTCVRVGSAIFGEREKINK